MDQFGALKNESVFGISTEKQLAIKTKQRNSVIKIRYAGGWRGVAIISKRPSALFCFITVELYFSPRL